MKMNIGTTDMLSFVFAVNNVEQEQTGRELARIALKAALSSPDALDALLLLLRENQYPTASVWIAMELPEAYSKSRKEAMRIFASILKGGNTQAINEALLAIRTIVGSMDSDGKQCDDLTKKEIIESWQPYHKHQWVWGKILLLLGARDVAEQYMRVFEGHQIDDAIDFGTGANLVEQVKELLPKALQSSNDDAILSALHTIEEWGILGEYSEAVIGLLDHPNEKVRQKVASVLAEMADRDKSGKARKAIAQYIRTHTDLSLALVYLYSNRTIDEDVLDALLSVCAAYGGKSAGSIIEKIVRRANSDEEVAKQLLAYQPSNEQQRYHRRILSRLRIHIGQEGT